MNKAIHSTQTYSFTLFFIFIKINTISIKEKMNLAQTDIGENEYKKISTDPLRGKNMV